MNPNEPPPVQLTRRRDGRTLLTDREPAGTGSAESTPSWAQRAVPPNALHLPLRRTPCRRAGGPSRAVLLLTAKSPPTVRFAAFCLRLSGYEIVDEVSCFPREC
ncbi:hypothetical protein CEXT_752011 [Caerostris extrusa]|uniref:Uncharacterized protein n=1 Tax=Caerostris extrusa TaxID=172846 RepID=A0AAV4Y8M6_CAEEX|nr:hypothetical protein CEXT_752011 [Caerostris extrusa]